YQPIKVVTAIGADAPDVAIARATVSGGGAEVPGVGEYEFTLGPPRPFMLETFEARVLDSEENDSTQAGGHPFTGVAYFKFPAKRRLVTTSTGSEYLPIEQVKQVITDVPRGFVGNAISVPKLCPGVEEVASNTCPPASVVGGIHIVLSEVGVDSPISAIEHEFGTPAQFAFTDPIGNIYTLSARLRADDGYAVSFELAPAPKVNLLESKVTLCDFGGRKSVGGLFTGCQKVGEGGANPIPLFPNPTRCDGSPPVTKAAIDSWEHQGKFVEREFVNAAITGCDQVHFEPEVELKPTTAEADSPSGLDIEVKMSTEGLESPTGISQANLKQVRVVFPPEMAVNASAGQGLGACSADQIKLKTNLPIECPDSSKIASVEVESPVIE